MSALTVDVIDASGKKAGKAELPAELFDVQVNIPLIHQVVVAQQAAARQGTHATKTRAMVSGGGIKPWRQKGTGRARQGSRRAPQWTGGGVVHGPQPRSYAQRTPKKMIAAALRAVLSDRTRDGKLFVLDSIVAGDTPSTKAALAALKAVGRPESMIVVLDRSEDLAWLSLRNLAGVHALAVDQLNVYDVLVNEQVVFTKAALDTFVVGPLTGKSAKGRASSAELLIEVAPEAEAKVVTASATKAPAKAAKAEAAPAAKKPAAKKAEAEAPAKAAKAPAEKAADKPAAKKAEAPAKKAAEAPAKAPAKKPAAKKVEEDK